MIRAPNRHQAATLVVAVAPLLSLLVLAQEKKDFSYTVGPRAVISIMNNCGSILVKPSGNRQVLVTTVSHSHGTTFVNEQHGKRIELRADCSPPRAGLADYTLLIPADSFVSLRSFSGNVHLQGLRGDVIMETMSGSIEASEIADAYVHVKTLSGPVNLNGIRDSHLDVHSVRGDVNIQNVRQSFLEVRSGNGRITYEGDPGTAGEYLLMSHSGDLEVSIPASASVEIKTQSMKGDSDQKRPNPGAASEVGHWNLLVKPGTVNASRFVLRSFSGKIRLKRP